MTPEEHHHATASLVFFRVTIFDTRIFQCFGLVSISFKNRRAIVLGTRSFGKASVQTVIPLGGHGAMRLTTARYYTPSGASIQARGIFPDIIVEQARIERLGRGPRRSEADLRGSLSNEENNGGEGGGEGGGDDATGASEDDDKGDDEEAGKADAGESRADSDYQLARALDLLRGLQLLSSTMVN